MPVQATLARNLLLITTLLVTPSLADLKATADKYGDDVYPIVGSVSRSESAQNLPMQGGTLGPPSRETRPSAKPKSPE